jgi:Mn-dependent DtxR family transcriptional regulator
MPLAIPLPDYGFTIPPRCDIVKTVKKRGERMSIRESGENYLEAILILETKEDKVRSIDVADYLNVSRPSVSRAVSILKDGGYLEQDSLLRLTKKGREIAQSMYDRHSFLTEFLVSIGVAEDTAVADACRIEHVISEESFSKLREHFRVSE